VLVPIQLLGSREPQRWGWASTASSESTLSASTISPTRDGRLQLLVLAGAQALEGFDTDLAAPAGPALLSEVDHDEGEISDAAVRQHPLRTVSGDEPIPGIIPNDITVEVWQESHHILHQRRGIRSLAGQRLCAVAFDIDLLQPVGQLSCQGEGPTGLHAKRLGEAAVRGRLVRGEITPEDLTERRPHIPSR
jgi:hypothetical protein